ncbi:MAG TPA: hypothetical protein VGL09_09085 [Methylomirabilota bacterium]|jgi:hypothetical protein
MSTFRIPLCVAFAVFVALVTHATFLAATVEARTIQITSGVFSAFGSFGGASGNFAGDGFSFSGVGLTGGGVNPNCFPCHPGDVLFLRTTYSGSDLPGSGVIDGVPRSFGMLLPFLASLVVEFNGSLIVPPPPPSSADVGLDAPFTFTGLVSSLTPGENLDLVGGGNAHVVLTPITTGALFMWNVRQTDFTFSPVPEPGTLAFVTGGVLVGIARAVRGRRADWKSDSR